jgi:hypothetical protein
MIETAVGGKLVSVPLQVTDENRLQLLLILLAGFFGGLYLIYSGFQTWRLARLMQNTPTEKVRSIAVGRTELEGVARPHEQTTDPPYEEASCVYVDWTAKRREKTRDEDGNVEYEWRTVASGTDAHQFELEDDTGRVLVRGDEGPEFEVLQDDHETEVTYSRGESPPREVVSFVYGEPDREAATSGAPRAGADEDEGLLEEAVDAVAAAASGGNELTDTDRRRKYRQSVVPVGTEAYVFGSAEPRDAGMEGGQQDMLEIREDPASERFVVADTKEKRLREQYSKMGPIKTVVGLALSSVALYLLLRWGYVPLG